MYSRAPVFNPSKGRHEIPNKHDKCPKTGKFIITEDNPYYCEDEGWIYPWHLEGAGPECPLIAEAAPQVEERV